MRKIDKKFENFIDNYVLDFVDYTEKYFRYFNVTPNQLTTVSLIFGCLSAYFFYLDKKIISITLLCISYYFDCLDGHYARKYKLETEFGDYYDHFCDLFKFLLFFYVMYLLNNQKFNKILPFIPLFSLFILIHLGCQEHLYKSSIKQPCLDKLKNLCKNPSWINITKYFGCGTQILFLIFLIYSY